MKDWRPDNWENPHKYLGGTTLATRRYYKDDLKDAYEAGAGAILEGISELVCNYCPADSPSACFNCAFLDS